MRWLYGLVLGAFAGFALKSVLGSRPMDTLKGVTSQLAALGGLAAELPTAGRQDPLGGMMPDERMTRTVREGLQGRGLAASSLDITTVDGVVYLRGRLADAGARAAIVGFAESVPGVVRVVDELKVPEATDSA